jgi:hypothetical protein
MPNPVEEADKKADELLKEMYPEQFEKEDDDKKEEEEEKEEEAKDEGEDDGEDTKTDDTEEKATDETKTKSDDWEQKYKVLKGKYDKEVPELHRATKQLQEEMSSLKESLSTKRSEKKATLEEEKTTDPDIAYLAEEFPDIHRAVAKMLAEGKNPKVEERLSSVETSVTQQAQDKFFKDLAEAVPDWQTIRDDERFVTWLNEVDELTDAPRFQLALLAQNNLNGKQLARFYNRFKKEVLGNGDDTSETSKSEKDLEKHTGMPKSKAGKQPDTKGKESDYVSREDIKKFYRDAASGKFVGDEDAFKRMESKIHKAMQEGRIN